MRMAARNSVTITGGAGRSAKLPGPDRAYVGERTTPPNKGMKQTKLVAAPGIRNDVPPRAFRRFAAVRTASQLIPGVRQTIRRGA